MRGLQKQVDQIIPWWNPCLTALQNRLAAGKTLGAVATSTPRSLDTLHPRRYHISVCCGFAAAVWILSSDTITIERSPLAPRSQSSSLFHHCHWLMEPGLDLETFDFPPPPS